MSALRVRALEGMKQLVKKTEHDFLPCGSALTVFSVNAGYWFACSLGGFAASFLIPMRIMVMTAQALGILILHEKRLLTLVKVRCDQRGWRVRCDPQLHILGTAAPRQACAS